MILFDTNVLVHAINADAPQHRTCRDLVEAVQARRVDGVLVPQVLLEFYAIVTDPRRVARPLDPTNAWTQVEALRTIFPVRDAGSKALDHLRDLLKDGKTTGGDVFDAFLVAQMRACNISAICTCNVRDFARFGGIMVHSPEDLARR